MNDPHPPAAAPPAPTSAELESAWSTLEHLQTEIGKVLIGQQGVLEQLLVAMAAAGHVLVEGVPGLGKTLMVRALAASVAGSFGRIQFTSDLMPSDITGHAIYDLKTEEFRIRRGPVFCNFLLADEINRAPAKTQAALLEVMQEGQVTIEGKPFLLKPPFLVLATQNPVEQEGTYPLPEAQLDRFLLKVLMEYPEPADERVLVRSVVEGHVGDRLDLSMLQPQTDLQGILALQATSARLTVDERVLEYAVDIVLGTREHPGLALGSGPRGGIALIRAARGLALLRQRDFVTPDDIKDVARAALRHRLTLAAELTMEGGSADEVIDELLERVAAPRL